MDISPLEIYVILQADGFRHFMGVLVGLMVGGILISGFCAMPDGHEDAEERENLNKWRSRAELFFFWAVLLGVLTSLAPSTNTLVAMFGLPMAVDAVASLEGAEQIPQNTVDALNRLLEGVGE